MTDAFATASTMMNKARSPRTIAVDNLLRKALRVSDPRDPSQIANALLVRYPEEAERDRRERAGLPYSSIPDFLPVPGGGPSAGSVELAQAQDDLERDIQTLSTSSHLKDIRVELIGWGRAVRQIASDGLAAARLALDSVSQDRAMSARRSLVEYARLGRYLGSLTDGSGLNFRRFAQSCDALAGLILVAIGEGLAANGITRSTTIVRAAAGELQSRRNAVIMTLRSLTGSVDTALGQEEWPRGLEAYRHLVQQLEDGGQADLRALLEENALAQAMDDLVDLSTGANVDGLRELSTTASLLIHRFQRLIQYGGAVKVPIASNVNGRPEAPPLVAFISALHLFVDAFAPKDSSRLLYIARPPIIVYGLYGVGGPGAGANRLISLANNRGFLLEQIDCAGGCGCDEDEVQCQVLLDYMLHLLDRSIDLYALGKDPAGFGEAEQRAAAAGFFIDVALDLVDPATNLPLCDLDADLKGRLQAIANILMVPLKGKPPAQWDARLKELIVREYQIANQAELQTERLVRSLAPACHTDLFDFFDDASLIRAVLIYLLGILGAPVTPPDNVDMPATFDASMATVAFDRPEFGSP